LPTPFVTLRTRLPGFTATELRTALEPGGTLVKLRTCRRTLHIYPLADAGVPHAATLRQRLGACAASVRRLGHDPAVLARIAPLIREALAAGPLSNRELEQRVVAARPRIRARRELLVLLVRLSIKWLWESGELLYRNTADSLHRERREFGLTATAHPALQLNHLASSDAVTALLRRYLAAFGPAAVEDFQWWSGLPRGDITPAVAALRPDLVDVQIGQDLTPLLLLAEDESRLRAAEPLPSNHVALLAYEDPTLKGYHATRHRYVDHQHRTRLFNTIGEARASIALAGRYAGTWQFHRSTRTISHNLDTALSPATQRAIVARLHDMIEFLRSEPC
jgi:hypothetical protein